jgi:anti-anti-sigma factor
MLGVNSDCRHLVIDLSELTFIDSIGLGILLGAKKLSRERAFPAFRDPLRA